MKTKNLLFCTLLAAMLAGCADSDDQTKSEPNAKTIPGAVGFDAYQQRSTTRSGWAGVLDIGQLKATKADGGGFGVFAYYTDLKKYDRTYVPNFMYNQGVFFNGENGTSGTGVFEYSPIMYWPNEYGFDASSDDEDHLSFFAYAPYVQHTSAAAGSVADATYGIVGFSRNNATGDPLVKYVASFDLAKSVDLCWGVVPSDMTTWARIQGGSTQTFTEGLPWVDVYRPLETASQTAATSSRVKFKFNHALAQLNVQIDTDADVTTHQDGTDPDALDPATKVYVRSISFTGLALQGALNLNNVNPNEALWLDWCGCTDLSYGEAVTVHDGRRDGREGAPGAEASNETPQGLNPDIIQNSTSTPGVLPTYQNLFAPTLPIADPDHPTDDELAARLQEAVCVIPTGETMTVTIVYDIETENPSLASYLSDGVTHGVSIENKVTKTVTFDDVYGEGLENNKHYTLRLHLGMNSVKFEAEVSDWVESTNGGDAWLPSNTRPIVLNRSVMYIAEPTTLTATTDPIGQAVTWDNTDGDIATFSATTPYPAPRRAPQHIDGSYAYNTVTMTPVAVGQTTVTASLANGDKAICEVHVVPVTLTGSDVTTPASSVTTPAKDISMSVNMCDDVTLTAQWMNTSGSATVSWNISPSGGITITDNDDGTCSFNCSAEGIYTITATNSAYTSGGGADYATCTLTVTAQTPTYTAPMAKTPTYNGTNGNNGTPQALVVAGSVTGGTDAKMQYGIGTSTTPPDSYADDISVGTDAGTYYVWYQVVGGTGYSNIEDLGPVEVTIQKKDPCLKLQDYNMGYDYGPLMYRTVNADGTIEFDFGSEEGTTYTPYSHYNDLRNYSGTIGSGMFTLFHVCHVSNAKPTVTGSGCIVSTPKSEDTDDHTEDTDVMVTGAGTITVHLAETTNYKAASATFTATVTDYVDLGLSMKWATKNIGASSPTDYGGYYAWANTSESSSYDESGDQYYDSDYSTYNNYKKYIITDNKTTLEAMDDAATANWGTQWKMPTYEECGELVEVYNVDYSWDGIKGRMFIYHVDGETDRLLFLPYGGRKGYYRLQEDTSTGYYWSSSLNTEATWYGVYAKSLYVDNGHAELNNDKDSSSNLRYYGYSVRAVYVP